MLIDEIKSLEKKAKRLEVDKISRDSWLNALSQYTDHFFSSSNQAVSSINYCDLDPRFLEVSTAISIDDAINLFHQNVIDTSVNPASSRYLAYIPGGGIFSGAIGDYLAAMTNCYAATYSISPGAVKMEHALLRWMAEIVGYPNHASGNLTSGGSMANLIAIVTARKAHALKSKDIERTVIYMTQYAHHSNQKCLQTIGLDEVIIRYISVDEHYRMNVKELNETIAIDQKNKLIPWLIIASAGTTDTGSVDPLSDIAKIAQRHQLWLHIDAAYGGFFALTHKGKKILNGIEEADSITLDPHKGLFLPYGIGAVLIKNAKQHREAFTVSASYMQDTAIENSTLSPADLSPELSKHFRALRLWFSLKLFGIDSFSAALTEKLLLTKYFYEKLKTLADIEICCSPQLSIVAFRYKKDPNVNNPKIMDIIRKDGRIFISSTRLNGDFYLRIACLGYRTHLEDIDIAFDVIQQAISNLK